MNSFSYYKGPGGLFVKLAKSRAYKAASAYGRFMLNVKLSCELLEKELKS